MGITRYSYSHIYKNFRSRLLKYRLYVRYNYKRKLKRKSKKHSKRKHSSRRKGKVKYTKNGQPYIILASGKARFIKGKRRKN